MIKNCLICKKEFYAKPSQVKRGCGKFCSRKCYEYWYSGNKGNFSRGGKIDVSCSYCGKENTIFKCRKMDNNFCNRECFLRWKAKKMLGKKLTPEHIENAKQGRKRYYDRIGRSDRTLRRRVYDENYKKWREGVFQRDDWTCQICETRSGGGKRVYIEPHHIRGWKDFPVLRYEISNGVTLCKKCHRIVHKYEFLIKGLEKENVNNRH